MKIYIIKYRKFKKRYLHAHIAPALKGRSCRAVDKEGYGGPAPCIAGLGIYQD